MDRANSAENRRRFPRLTKDVSVQLKQVPDNYSVKIHNSILRDISEGGLQISSFYFYPVNFRMPVEVSMSPDRPPVQGVGRVVWVEQLPYQERYKVGIEFTELNEHSRRQLRDMAQRPSIISSRLPA